MYKQDVVKLDRQDDGAAYRAFCSSNLRNVYLQHLENPEDEEMCRFFVLLFIFGELIDCYLNRQISPLERIKMAMTFFFLRFWCQHILNLSENYPDFISLKKNFLADQSYSILTSLAESMILLIKAHCEYYSSVPLLPWMHGSEAVEHFFGIARQINSDFTYAELIHLIPKIAQCSKALRNNNLIYEKEKSVREGIINLQDIV
uniref:Uncharacterized protein n=1 Tax=Rhizophagus irregularis (strain DAOM 181602 / DAOM 197198 / MUCL 43194) TaxID=747089 RepID=U9SS17_RHIID